MVQDSLMGHAQSQILKSTLGVVKTILTRLQIFAALPTQTIGRDLDQAGSAETGTVARSFPPHRPS